MSDFKQLMLLGNVELKGVNMTNTVCQNFIKDLKIEKKKRPKKDHLFSKKKTKKRPFQAKRKDLKIKKRPKKRPYVVLAMQTPP